MFGTGFAGAKKGSRNNNVADMSDHEQTFSVARPTIYLARMIVFLVLAGLIAAVLFPRIREAFMANPGLNGLILFALLLGVLYTFRMVIRLFREVNWVNHFRITDPGQQVQWQPRLLAPMAALLREHHPGRPISPQAMRSLLDSLGSRLDESRDISRYLIGLLVFLGLLGTFWGLLQTIASVGEVIRNLDVRAAQGATIFEELKAGLQAPLAGMGTAFSSSLFGLAGSLLLGFLDLQAAQAQNRFYTDVEDWLSSITDIAAGEGADATGSVRSDLAHLHQGMAQLQQALAQLLSHSRQQPLADAPHAASAQQPQEPRSTGEALERLATAITHMVQQMRSEERLMRDWARGHSQDQQQMLHLLRQIAELLQQQQRGGDEQSDSQTVK